MGLGKLDLWKHFRQWIFTGREGLVPGQMVLTLLGPVLWMCFGT